MTSGGEGTGWFLAQLKPNCDRIAVRNLARQGFRTFLPRERATRRQGGRFVEVVRPLFPGYLFLAFDPGAGHWRAVNSTLGVSRLVAFGNRPAAVPDEIVALLGARCDEAGLLLPEPALQAGDSVRVTAGPFADFVARIETIAPDRRIWLLLDILGGQTRVAVPAGTVSRMGAARGA